MKSKQELMRDAERFRADKNLYFEKIRAYRLALMQPYIFNEKTLALLLNEAEKAYRRVGFEFGDEGDRGYP